MTFKFEYLGKFEFIFKANWGYELGEQMDFSDE